MYLIYGRKHPQIVLDSYIFNVQRTSGTKSRWRCKRSVRSLGSCKAFLVISGKWVHASESHNHPCEDLSLKIAIPQSIMLKRVE
ncbi:unnamed protein product [Ceutorhynchus assimilis]|uniref:FLYWCH-type domain-containing protein n=1 Tax=Ceutorhynchus assimilis TaxID=467358 RepID=A0A9N9QC75_9CUCU|nr:unnamed protein product [Ceutorhynchus assimilis]